MVLEVVEVKCRQQQKRKTSGLGITFLQPFFPIAQTEGGVRVSGVRKEVMLEKASALLMKTMI